MNRNSTPKIGLAVFLILFGMLLLMDRLGFYRFGDVIHIWWPLILIYIGLQKIISGGRQHFLGAGIFLMVGLWFLLITNHVLDSFTVRTIWPMLIILLGVWLIVQTLVKPIPTGVNGITASDIRSVNIFSSFTEVYQSKPLNGGSIFSLFGGTKIDLRACEPAAVVYLDVTSLFSSVILNVPADWSVVYQVTPFFSGIEDKRILQQRNFQKELRIVGFAGFSGIEIKD